MNVATDGLADSVDSVWAIGGSGGSITTLVIELAGFAANNKFGIYDAKTPASTVQVFDGAASAGSQAVISILADGSVVVNFFDTGVDFASNRFGFYLDTQVDQPGVGLWRSETGLNSDGLDHLAAYEGLGADTIQILPFAAGVWGTNEYILAWEDLDNSIGGADRDYTDFVVLVESVSPMTLPEPGSIMVWSLLASLGVGLVVRKRISLR